MIERIINKIRIMYYKRLLERRAGRRLPTVKVMGELRFESVTLDIGENVIFYPRVTFSGNGTIRIGSGSKIGQDCILHARADDGGISIGEGTIIAAQTYIIDSNHNTRIGVPIPDQGMTSRPIRIGNDVWIGANCTIVAGSEIRDGAIIGAKSLVNSVIEENAIAFGTPARKRKTRG